MQSLYQPGENLGKEGYQVDREEKKRLAIFPERNFGNIARRFQEFDLPYFAYD